LIRNPVLDNFIPYRFGLPKIKNTLFWIPDLDEVFSKGALYLLERPKD